MAKGTAENLVYILFCANFTLIIISILVDVFIQFMQCKWTHSYIMIMIMIIIITITIKPLIQATQTMWHNENKGITTAVE